MKKTAKKHVIYDPIYGFIQLTDTEFKIIHTPFYQRLRWIRQLGFSSYVFHGAEHSRFGHSIGVMFNAHKILQSIQKSVPDEELFDIDHQSEEASFHRKIRLGALMHDLGTFPFSHTTEMGYLRFQKRQDKQDKKEEERDDHENLGSYIIKRTNFEDGITKILLDDNFDPDEISNFVKGDGPSVLGNQILHSEIDCDRMDYLLRDAHYTGLNYGSYDRDYLLYHFQERVVKNQSILTIRHSALHCVEDFLSSRFAWYSQVVRSARGAKYDAIAEELTVFFLQQGWLPPFRDLLGKIKKSPLEFYHFNDAFFLDKVYQHYTNGDLDKYLAMKDMAKSILFQVGPKIIRIEEFKQRLLDVNDKRSSDKVWSRAQDKIKEIQEIISKKGGEEDWVVADLPSRNIVFVKSHKKIVEGKKGPNLLLERDPVKISYEYNGDIKLLTDVENSTISRLSNYVNFIPNIYCSQSAHELLKKEGFSDRKGE